MAANSSIPEENIFECTICLETYTEPKLLPCFHTFCKKCLAMHIRTRRTGNVFPCPNCRQDCKIPQNEENGFQTNFYIIAALTSEAKMKNKLIEMSLSAADTSNARSKKSEDRNLFDQPCPKHKNKNQVLQFYCIKCDTPICIHCKLTAHEGHDTRDLEDIIHRTKIELAGLGEKLNSYVDLYKTAREASADLDKKTDHNLQTLKASVIGNAEHLHDMIDNRKQILLDVISKNQKKEANKIVQYRKEMERSSKKISDLVKGISKEQNKHDILVLLKLKTTINDQIKTMDTTPTEYFSLVQDVKYDRPENQNSKAKDAVNNFLGQIKVNQTNGTVVVNGQPVKTPQVATAPPVFNADRYRKMTPCLIDTVFRPRKDVIRCFALDSQGRFWTIYDPIGLFMEQYNANGTLRSKMKISGKDLSGITLLSAGMVVVSSPSQKALYTLHDVGSNTYEHSDRSKLPDIPVAVHYYNKQVYALLCGKGSAKGLYNADKEAWMYRSSLLKKPFDFVVTKFSGKLTAVITDPQGKQVIFLQENENGSFVVKSIYKGEGLDVPQLPTFQPKGVTATNRGHFLVADEGNSIILKLDERTGALIGILTLEPIGIGKPRAIHFTETATWVSNVLGGLYKIKQ